MTANHPTHAGKFYLTKPVFFIGFMGAGKTSISQQIAVTCGVASIDADEYLEFREEIMKEAGYVVYLKVSADGAAARIPNTDSRPMFKNLETARKTIVEREPQYEAAADVSVDTEGRTIRDVADEVVELLLDAGVLVKRD